MARTLGLDKGAVSGRVTLIADIRIIRFASDLPSVDTGRAYFDVLLTKISKTNLPRVEQLKKYLRSVKPAQRYSLLI
jgi:hypothetical protein